MINFKNIIIFSLGAAIGSVVTWKLVKAKYEQIAQEEIDSVKEVYSRNRKKIEKKTEEPKEEKTEKNEETDLDEAKTMVESLSYVSDSEKEEKQDDMRKAKRPYVISPDEFGDQSNYEIVSLTYYADGVLTDDCDEVIEDVDDLVGKDSLNHFGEYEDDSVFVRNEKYKTDYEILLDLRNYYSVVTKENPSSENQ